MAELSPTRAEDLLTTEGRQVSGDVDTDGVRVRRERMLESSERLDAITTRETLSGGVWTVIRIEPHTDKLVWKITETRSIPGEWVPFTRYDDNLGAVQGKRRLVAAVNQAASLTATVKTTYDARNGSSLVVWEVVETSGSGISGFTAYPINTDDYYDDDRGAVQKTNQLVLATGTEVGSIAKIGSVVTETEYIPFNEFLLRKTVETYSVPGPARVGSVKTGDDQLGTIARQLVDASTAATVTTTTESSAVRPINEIVAMKETTTVPALFDAMAVGDTSEISFPVKFLTLAKDETITTTIAGSTATPDTITNTGLGIISADAQRVSDIKVRKRTTTRAGTPTPLNGFDFDEATGLLLPTTDQVVAAGTAGVALDSGGNYSTVTPLNTVWSIKSTRKATALTTRSFAKGEFVSLPRVLTVFEAVAFNDASGFIGTAGYYHVLKDYSGAYDVTVTETWSATAHTGLSITQLRPEGFSWLTPFDSGTIPPCLHGAITISGTTGTDNPDWQFATWNWVFAATTPSSLSGNIVLVDTQQPWRGGYLRHKETITVS